MVTRPATPEEAQAFFDTVFINSSPPPSAAFLGWTFVDLDVHGKTMTVDFIATEQMLNPAGTVQGGMLTAMLDDTMGPLTFILSAGRLMASSTDIHTQYFRPARIGKIRCKARVTRQGRNLNYTSAELYDEKDRVLASAIQTAMMRPFGR
jgi:uncharacterized protein (TIGR00369 family)